MMALCSKAFIAALLFVVMALPRRALADAEEDWSERPYVYLKDDGASRCFIVTVGRTAKPGGSFHVHYYLRKKPDDDHETGATLKLYKASASRLKDKGEEIESLPIKPGEGTEHFHTKDPGMYHLCASMVAENKDEKMKLSLEIDGGPEDKMFDKLKEKYKLDEWEIKMVKVRRKVQDMLMKADYLQGKEVEYHQNVIKLNREVALWPVLQVVILVATGYYQVKHLKQFFKAKRLV